MEWYYQILLSSKLNVIQPYCRKFKTCYSGYYSRQSIKNNITTLKIRFNVCKL